MKKCYLSGGLRISSGVGLFVTFTSEACPKLVNPFQCATWQMLTANLWLWGLPVKHVVYIYVIKALFVCLFVCLFVFFSPDKWNRSYRICQGRQEEIWIVARRTSRSLHILGKYINLDWSFDTQLWCNQAKCVWIKFLIFYVVVLGIFNATFIHQYVISVSVIG